MMIRWHWNANLLPSNGFSPRILWFKTSVPGCCVSCALNRWLSARQGHTCHTSLHVIWFQKNLKAIHGVPAFSVGATNTWNFRWIFLPGHPWSPCPCVSSGLWKPKTLDCAWGFSGPPHIGATCHMPVNLWTFIIDFAEVEHTSLKNPSWSSWNLFQWRLVMSICIFPAIFMALNLGKNRSWTCGPSALLMCKRCHVWLGLESGRAWKGVEGCGRVWNLRFQKAHVI